MINVEVERNQNENTVSLLKRFTRRVQGSGILPRVRSIRYHTRNRSEYVKKKQTLKVLEHRKNVAQLVKLGKLPEKISK